jgi:hypothetical protein
MLRPLKHEIPAQMREADERVTGRIACVRPTLSGGTVELDQF